MLRRLVARVRRGGAALGRFPTAVLCVAALVTAVMYATNDLADAEPAAARGDGRYRPVMARGDGHMHFLITRSLVFDRDVDFDNDLARFGDPWNQPRTVTGRKNVMQQIGPSLVWAPLLAAAHGVASMVNVVGGEIEPHGYTMFHQRILYASSVVFAWIAIVLGILVAYRIIGGRWAPTWAGVATLLGTTLTYYATYMPSYAHAMDAAAAAGFLALWALTLGELRWRRFVILGGLLGLAAMVRVQDVGLGLVLVVELGGLALARVRSGEPGRAGAALAILLRGAVVLAIAIVLHVPQFVVWKQMYGAYLTTPQGPGQMRYGHPMVLELLFSSRNGWLSTHPLAYLGCLGLVVGAIRGPRWGAHVRIVCGAMLLVIAGQVYINAVTYEWWSAASFGQRRMASMSLPLVVGLAALLRAARGLVGARLPAWAQQAIAVGVLGYFIAWNLAWVGALSDARPAGRDNRPTCCGDVPRPLAWIARPVYARIGNPFQLPASALFALEHGVSLRRWDVAVGSYALVPGVLGYEDGSYRRATATWNLSNAGGAPYLLEGWGPPQVQGRAWRWTTAPVARALLPLLMPEPHRVTIPIAANAAPAETIDVVIRCNGVEVGRTQAGSTWTSVTFETDGTIGHSVITIEASVRPYRASAGPDLPAAPPGGVPVGVAMGPWRVALPPR